MLWTCASFAQLVYSARTTPPDLICPELIAFDHGARSVFANLARNPIADDAWRRPHWATGGWGWAGEGRPARLRLLLLRVVSPPRFCNAQFSPRSCLSWRASSRHWLLWLRPWHAAAWLGGVFEDRRPKRCLRFWAGVLRARSFWRKPPRSAFRRTCNWSRRLALTLGLTLRLGAGRQTKRQSGRACFCWRPPCPVRNVAFALVFSGTMRSCVAAVATARSDRTQLSQTERSPEHFPRAGLRYGVSPREKPGCDRPQAAAIDFTRTSVLRRDRTAENASVRSANCSLYEHGHFSKAVACQAARLTFVPGL